MAKEKKPLWWKMFVSQKNVLELLPDDAVGTGLKAAFRYFDSGYIDDQAMTRDAYMAFEVMRPYIDSAIDDYYERVENGKKGAEKRWSRPE